MAEGTRGTSGDGASARRFNRSRAERAAEPKSSGRQIPVTADPSLQNIVGGFYNSLPPVVRELLPFGSEGSGTGPDRDGDEAPKDKRGETSWQDVCFIYSIPGDDNDEGL